jgi:hypothetical protein
MLSIGAVACASAPRPTATSTLQSHPVVESSSTERSSFSTMERTHPQEQQPEEKQYGCH